MSSADHAAFLHTAFLHTVGEPRSLVGARLAVEAELRRGPGTLQDLRHASVCVCGRQLRAVKVPPLRKSALLCRHRAHEGEVENSAAASRTYNPER